MPPLPPPPSPPSNDSCTPAVEVTIQLIPVYGDMSVFTYNVSRMVVAIGGICDTTNSSSGSNSTHTTDPVVITTGSVVRVKTNTTSPGGTNGTIGGNNGTANGTTVDLCQLGADVAAQLQALGGPGAQVRKIRRPRNDVPWWGSWRLRARGSIRTVPSLHRQLS